MAQESDPPQPRQPSNNPRPLVEPRAATADAAVAAESVALAGQAQRVLGSLTVGDVVSGSSALALLIVLFAFAWYGVAGRTNPSAALPAPSITQDGFTALPLTRWEIVATIIFVFATLVLHAMQRTHGTRTETGLPILLLGLLTAGLLAWRVLVTFPSPNVIDQKFGALLGLACALGIAYGGHELLVEQRDRRRAARTVHRRRPTASGAR